MTNDVDAGWNCNCGGLIGNAPRHRTGDRICRIEPEPSAPLEVIAGRKIHPAASAFPMMGTAELTELAADIGKHKQRLPCIEHEGLILDGRNRLAACEIAGVKPWIEKWNGGPEDSAAAYVVSVNIPRRHLNPSQKAMVAAKLLPVFKAEAAARLLVAQAAGRQTQTRHKALLPGEKAPPGVASRDATPSAGKAAAHAAAATGVATRQVERADIVLRKATPELAAKVDSGEVSLKAAERQIRRAEQHIAISKYVPPAGRYNVIVSDNPWQFDTRVDDDTHRGRLDYPTMTVDEMCAMGPLVMSLCDDDCILFLWTTKQHLLDHSARRVAIAWGFEVRTFWDWVKVDKAGKIRKGSGSWGMNCSEHVLICTRGKPAVNFDGQAALFLAQRPNEHSRKPDEFFEIVERCCSGTARLEMFSRESREGWVTNGAEGGQFDSKPKKVGRGKLCGVTSGNFKCSSPAGHIGSHRAGEGRGHLWPAESHA